ncbi:MAG: glycosyltransferase [Candidatus Levybacteria bacterium]|nr:glycosyltransferase [Candidatus Levybacteria bacterium]
MKVALVYDRVNKWGGAERVLLALNKIFPKAPLFTSVYNKKTAPWAEVFDIKTSFLQKNPHAIKNHEMYPFMMPLAFERFSFDKYDLVISITSEAAKGIVTKPGTKHISYILTPTRYLWSGYEEYFTNRPLRMAAHPVVSYLRKWDKAAAARPDVLVAISTEVQERIKKYYQRDSFIIYPPVSLGVRGPHFAKASRGKQSLASSNPIKNNNYFLIVSRLSKFTQYKRVDLAIEACNRLKLPLKIVGTGSLRKELEKLAGPTVEFVGDVSDRELVQYYTNCKALIFPAFEDFGLVVVEAQSFGKPVIALRKGGALDTIKEGKTGIFFDEQNVESLTEALKVFENMQFDPKAAKKQAGLFSEMKFKEEFLRLVKKVI